MTILKIDPAKNPKKSVPGPAEEGEIVSYVDCTPHLTPETYLELFDMNMSVLRKEFGPGWTKAQKIGGKFADDSLHRAVDARYGFIKHWYELLEADLHILDHIARVRGYDRQHLPGVVSCVVVNIEGWYRGLVVYFRGKPLQAIPKDDLKAEIERLAGIYKEKPSKNGLADLKKNIEYYLRGRGYETLDIEETVTIEV